MTSSKKYKARYSGRGSKGGSYEAFEFEVIQEPGEKRQLITCRIAEHIPHDAADPFHLHKIAAGAVKLHLLGRLLNVRYDGGGTFTLSSYYEPSETIDSYEEFEVTPPKPTLGFKTPSK